MNLPIIVDVVIGLVFIFLILSLLAAEIQELVTTILQWRAKHLKESIINPLSGDTISENSIRNSKKLTQQLYSHPLLKSVNQEARGLFALLFRRITWVFSFLYQGIVGEENNFGSLKTAPSYIPAETFATALIEQLGVAKFIERLVEAKFRQFQKLVISKIKEIVSDPQKLTKLEDDFENISKRFDEREITLETAIDKTSLELDRCIQEKMPSEEAKELQSWKISFFGEKNELAIVNGGIKPTILEIVDSMDTTSRTYRNYEQTFTKHQNRRSKEG